MHMRFIPDFFEKGTTAPIVLTVAGLLGLLALLSMQASVFDTGLIVDMRTEPQQGLLTVGETFNVTIVVESSIPVNAFAGELLFNNDVLSIQSIDYNTSIADLWAERPWYSNGDGTLTFADGTTRPGGFCGTDTLITVTFLTKNTGAGQISINNARILQHDGFGTDTQLQEPIDTIFTVTEKNSSSDVLRKSSYGTAYVVTQKMKSPDLNNDGKQTIADISIFMMHLARGNVRSDFNGDGKVTTADLSIILNAQ